MLGNFSLNARYCESGSWVLDIFVCPQIFLSFFLEYDYLEIIQVLILRFVKKEWVLFHLGLIQFNFLFFNPLRR